jgi:hypothetical protein
LIERERKRETARERVGGAPRARTLHKVGTAQTLIARWMIESTKQSKVGAPRALQIFETTPIVTSVQPVRPMISKIDATAVK